MFATVLFGLALAIGQEGESPPEWVVTERGPWGVLALDRASLRTEDALLRFRALAVPANGGRMRGQSFAYQIVYWRADCRTGSAGVSGSEEFDATGEKVRYEIPDIPPLASPGPLPPDTPVHRLVEGACDGGWSDVEPLSSALEVYRAR